MLRNALGALLAGLTLLAVPSTASASLPYTITVQDYLHLRADPGCTLCHEDDKGGEGTATKPFGEAVQAFGAIGDDIGSLSFALEEMEYYGVDDDGDGVDDLDELRQGTDPNDGMDPPPVLPPPTGAGGDQGTDADSASADTTSGSDGSSPSESSGAGGTQTVRPRPPARRSLAPEMKTGCAMATANGESSAGALLLLVGLVRIARGWTTARLKPNGRTADRARRGTQHRRHGW